MAQDDPINLTNLKYFCDSVRLNGLSAAAKVNFVTQSAISQGISKLEKSLEISLIAHHPNRLRLTPEGEMVFNEGLEILSRSSELKKHVHQEGEHRLGNLEFASTYSFALAVIPEYLEKFRKCYPEIKVNFYLGRNANVKQMVKEGTIDFGILPDEGDLESFKRIDISEGRFGLYVSKLIPKSQQKKLGFILAEPHSKETLLLKAAYQKKFGKELSSVLEVSSWEMIANLVSKGMGIGYFPDYIANKIESLQLCQFNLELQSYKISAISPSGMKLRKSSEIFLSYFLKTPAEATTEG